MRLALALAYLAYAFGLSAMLRRAGFRNAEASRGSAAPKRPAGAQGTGPLRILIVGATGGTGRELVRQCLSQGHEVTALVRDPRRLHEPDPRLRVVVGDVLDPQAVARAVQGQQAVLCALGHKRFFGPTRILSRGTQNLIAAMEQAGARRLVVETALGIGDSAFRLGALYTLFTTPVILPFYFWDKARQERAVAASGLDWVIVRPAVLTQGAARGSVRHGLRVGNFLRSLRVSRADVAAFMLAQTRSDDYLRSAVGVAAT